ncbi:DUF3885 domain-containing protein [Pseudophaeobacter flagellatus]|uniref:DUF3885 domain-containing protein n=1 Tax=Pseudophaeobacter flagellatus TaxID=2899119 RepID=UPI001E28C1AC|nr:DUF3885 domain-containing protein [Pseudophaeobacter flagellatus]MCD9147735.1 DUF3885 domain-containing protein [Pseudophaeobacter flagellatus]
MTDTVMPYDHPFTCAEFPHSLFHDFEYALRFELGGETVPTSRAIKRFIQAFERCDAVAADLFKETTSLWLLSSSYGKKKPAKKRLKPYKECGIRRSNFQYLGALSPEETQCSGDEIEENSFRHWDCLELAERGQLRELLWLALGCELNIRPACFSDMYFVDFERGLVLHPYDDRGMDVAAVRKADLLSLYRSRYDWLLDFSIDRMKAVFDT